MMATTPINFTVKSIEALPLSTTNNPTKFKDDGGPQSVRYLYLYSGVRAKAFYFVRKINGRTTKYKIGEFPATTIEQARKRCNDLSSEADKGINPMEAKRAARQRGICLGDVFEQYMEQAKARAEKPLKETTEAGYRQLVARHFSLWIQKEAEAITFEMVEAWYTKAAKVSPTSANKALRIGRAIYNHQHTIAKRQKSGLFMDNPFEGHTTVKEKARDDCIDTEDMAEWFAAAQELSNTTTRDYLLVLLLTGLRRREAAPLQWDGIDLRRRTLTVKDTKNGTDHTIPLSTYIVNVFTRRKQASTSRYVFASTGASGYLTEPKKAIGIIAERTGIHASPHALRRTYSNFAAFEAGIHELARKRLLNHSIADDVTAKHYSVLRMPKLAKYQQMVTDSILEAAQQDRPSAEIFKLEAVSS